QGDTETAQKALLAAADAAKDFAPDDPRFAQTLSSEGLMDLEAGYPVEAARLFRKSLAIWSRDPSQDENMQNTASNLNNLGKAYEVQHKYAAAEPLYEQALAMTERNLGPDHASIAPKIGNLAVVCDLAGNYDKAEPLYRRCISLYEKHSGAY